MWRSLGLLGRRITWRSQSLPGRKEVEILGLLGSRIIWRSLGLLDRKECGEVWVYWVEGEGSNTQHGVCPYCNRYFKQIKIHIQTVHFKLKPYKCQFCSQTFGRSGNRLMHMRNKHAEVVQ
ncbi:hypothetical protein ACHWQZ_G001481 [Mnemiopsis leidyi]